MITEVKTVSDVDPEQFDMKVNACIASGYILTNISVLPCRERVVYVASFVKEDNKDTQADKEG